MATYLTRAEAITGPTKKLEFFSDFVTGFTKTPFGNQLGKVTNEQSVTQSLRNLLLTNLGERLFQPYIGSDINKSLFELNDEHYTHTLKTSIEMAIRNSEPRVDIGEITVTSVNDHSVLIKMVYNLINNPAPLTFEFLLKRVR
jgi:phage baseplate assembly protein W